MTPDIPPPLVLPFRPRQALLFSGHMIDAPDRVLPRFPPRLEAAAAGRIEEALERLEVNASDIALTQGSSGGDLLFAEACTRRGVPLQLMLPLPEQQFIERSILPSIDGEQWKQRFLALKAALPWPPIVVEGASQDQFERCNRSMVAAAAASKPAKLVLICLWDGGGGDGPGGTADMVRKVERAGGVVIRLDTRTLG